MLFDKVRELIEGFLAEEGTMEQKMSRLEEEVERMEKRDLEEVKDRILQGNLTDGDKRIVTKDFSHQIFHFVFLPRPTACGSRWASPPDD